MNNITSLSYALLGSTITWKKKRGKNRSVKDNRNYMKTQIGKNHGAAHKFTIYQRDYREEEENSHSRSVQWHSQ